MHMVTRDDDSHAVQSAHSNPTPRIGGLGICAGLVISIFLMTEALQWAYALFVISLAPVFVGGSVRRSWIRRLAPQPLDRCGTVKLARNYAVAGLG